MITQCFFIQIRNLRLAARSSVLDKRHAIENCIDFENHQKQVAANIIWLRKAFWLGGCMHAWSKQFLPSSRCGQCPRAEPPSLLLREDAP